MIFYIKKIQFKEKIKKININLININDLTYKFCNFKF